MGDKEGVSDIKRKGKSNPFRSIFMHADCIDMLLMILGLFGSIGDGFTTPLLLFVTSKIMNDMGTGPGDDPHLFRCTINKGTLTYLYLACGIFVVCFLEAYCWTRTGERQASRMRHRYLKAVLRQEVGYFDLKAGNTSEVVNSVSNDTLIIQDVISEKVPHLVSSFFMFFGSYIIAFVLVWRLALVGLPFALVLVIPGLIYDRILMGLSRKASGEYTKAGSVVEQAISSIRTVYSFVGENKTMTEFSAALEGSVKLGLKMGLAKGVAIGSNGIVFAVWALLAWYGSKLAMHHGYGGEGGTIFAAGTAITIGGFGVTHC